MVGGQACRDRFTVPLPLHPHFFEVLTGLDRPDALRPLALLRTFGRPVDSIAPSDDWTPMDLLRALSTVPRPPPRHPPAPRMCSGGGARPPWAQPAPRPSRASPAGPRQPGLARLGRAGHPRRLPPPPSLSTPLSCAPPLRRRVRARPTANPVRRVRARQLLPPHSPHGAARPGRCGRRWRRPRGGAGTRGSGRRWLRGPRGGSSWGSISTGPSSAPWATSSSSRAPS
jgi:hypothetical protein